MFKIWELLVIHSYNEFERNSIIFDNIKLSGTDRLNILALSHIYYFFLSNAAGFYCKDKLMETCININLSLN